MIQEIQQADEVLNGKAPLEAAREAVRHLCLMPVHKAALFVLAAHSTTLRRERLDAVPATIRDAVKAEANRVWQWRREKKPQRKRA